MRVLLICAAFPPLGKGGGPVSSQLLARGLADRGNVVRVLTVGDAEDLRDEGGMEVQTIRSPNVYWNYWKPNPIAAKLAWHALENFNPRALLRMRRAIRDYKPDVVATISIENINVASWLAARLERTPVAHVIYSYFLMCWRGTLFRGDRNCEKRCATCVASSPGKKLMSRYVDGLMGESQAVLNTHLNAGYFGKAITRVVPGAIRELPQTATVLSDTAPLRVGFIGLHSTNKGIETLARAARAIAADATVEFVIAGDGDPDYTQRLRTSFPSANTRFVGWVHADDFFPQIDVNVVPSIWAEPFGRVSIEAQSFGVPTLVGRSGGLPANIAEGKTGFSFDANDHLSLASHISELAANRRLLKQMGAAARQHAARYCLPRIAEEFEDFLQETREHAHSNRTR